MKCNNCGSELEQNSKFCEMCGVNVQNQNTNDNSSSDKNNPQNSQINNILNNDDISKKIENTYDNITSKVNKLADTAKKKMSELNFNTNNSSNENKIHNNAIDNSKLTQSLNNIESKIKAVSPIKVGIVAVIAIVIIMVIYFSVVLSIIFFDWINGNVKLSNSWSEYNGNDYLIAQEMLEKDGFSNFEFIENNNLEYSGLNNTVETVTIDGDSIFEQGDKYNKGAKIVITYNTVIQIAMPQSSQDSVGEEYNDTQNEFMNAGFKNIVVNPLNDLEVGEENDNLVESVVVGDSENFSADDIYPIDAEIVISYHSVKTIKVPFGADETQFENYENVQKAFEESGFTNIKLEKIEDLIIGWLTADGEIEEVLIDGDKEFSSYDMYRPDVEIIISYHTFPSENSYTNDDVNDEEQEVEQEYIPTEEDKALELVFPVEMARRAAIVSMTNNYATDVFSADGNSRDETKYHSYADVSGYHMTVHEDGVWSAKDENTWHVEDLVLSASSGVYLKASLDITFDGTNYMLLDGISVIGNLDAIESEDPNTTSTEEIISHPNNTYLVVSQNLIEEDRAVATVDNASEENDNDGTQTDSSDTSARETWIGNQFSLWNGAHIELEEIIKDNLNDEGSYKHIDTTYLDASSEIVMNEVNNMLSSSGVSQRIEQNDLFVITEFSAKNGYNATIKYQAMAIVSYETDIVTLIGIV